MFKIKGHDFTSSHNRVTVTKPATCWKLQKGLKYMIATVLRHWTTGRHKIVVFKKETNKVIPIYALAFCLRTLSCCRTRSGAQAKWQCHWAVAVESNRSGLLGEASGLCGVECWKRAWCTKGFKAVCGTVFPGLVASCWAVQTQGEIPWGRAECQLQGCSWIVLSGVMQRWVTWISGPPQVMRPHWASLAFSWFQVQAKVRHGPYSK